MASNDPIEQNIQGVQQLIGSKLNKSAYGGGEVEGVEGDYEDEFTLKLSDQELLNLSRHWESRYQMYHADIKARQDKNLVYYLGRQKEGSSIATDGPISANLLFEAEETFLPAALSKNPEPVVWADNTPEGNKISTDIKIMLQYHASTLALRRKLTLMTRHWSVYFIGVIKHGFDKSINEITSDVRDPKNFIFDPDGFVDPYADYEGPLGERITCNASKLIELFPKHREFITIMVNGMLGTPVTYTEWWNDDYCFYTFKGIILDKNKNPHFIPEKEVPQLGPDGLIETDETGAPLMTMEQGDNHFAKAKKPYTFLSVFSLGEHPHDVTNLIEQNIPNQRRISRRTEQIDFNLSRQNNSEIYSANNFDQEKAKQASNAIKEGHPVIVPAGGPIADAIVRLEAKGIDGAFFNELENSKNDLRSIFGTQGITATQQYDDQTARGMILNNQYDSSRIGGGIGDALEQVANNIFNWWVQLYKVYYDIPHTAQIMGQMKAVEYISLVNSNIHRKIVVSVSPDSMKPKDETNTINQALALVDKGMMDPKTLLTIMDFPDPQQTAAQVVLWSLNPQLYMQLNFPDLAQQIQAQNMQMMVAPQASGEGIPPEQVTEPPGPISQPPANAQLSAVPLPQ